MRRSTLQEDWNPGCFQLRAPVWAPVNDRDSSTGKALFGFPSQRTIIGTMRAIRGEETVHLRDEAPEGHRGRGSGPREQS